MTQSDLILLKWIKKHEGRVTFWHVPKEQYYQMEDLINRSLIVIRGKDKLLHLTALGEAYVA